MGNELMIPDAREILDLERKQPEPAWMGREERGGGERGGGVGGGVAIKNITTRALLSLSHNVLKRVSCTGECLKWQGR